MFVELGILAIAMTLVPPVAEIDFARLPTGTKYTLTVSVEAASGEKQRFSIVFSPQAGPEDAVESTAFEMKQRGWKVYKTGLKLVVVGHADSRVTKVKIDSTTTKPAVRWFWR